MRIVPKWVNKIHEADKVEFSSVHSICFSPDGSQLVIGAGEKVMVYDPRDGALVQLLQAHKGMVHAVAYCGDGKKFASGSADKNVIIWTSKMEGVLKYSHSEAIQSLAYNPVSFNLASCAVSDFAFWSAEVKAVQKVRVSGRITSCAWSPNGQYLAIGLASGAVSIREKGGEEINRISRDAAVWAIAFSGVTLLVTDWNDTLSFYNLQGQQVLKDRLIGISAMSIQRLGEMMLVGGVGGWAVLTAEGVNIITTPHEWVWCVAPSPNMNTMAVACHDGTLWCYQVVISTVHGLYRERYAYRENMTDVIIQHLTSGTKVRIKCHDRVQKIAIYKHRLAVQLPERVVVYEQGDADGMLYRVKEKLMQKIECSLLVTTTDSLLLCQDKKLAIIGRRVPKFWTMPAPIRYVKVTSLYFEEILLLGLLNGQIWQVDPKTGSHRLFLVTPSPIRCLDLSATRGRLAVVDDVSVCRVYSLPMGQLLYTEENVTSVSWNSWCEELVCLSGAGLLSIKAGCFPAATQPLNGSVVGFQGGRVFCLQSNQMQTINMPLAHAVQQYVQNKLFSDAYAVACLGITALDWERLGIAALEELSLEVAKKAFQRSENITFLTLIDHLQERLESGENRAVIVGEAMSYRGQYVEAVRAYRSVGREDRAMDLYVDLRMFNKAQELVVDGEGGAALARKRAEWARHVTEPRAAAEMYLAVGDVKRAAQLLADCSKTHLLVELARKLDKGSSESLRHVAEALITVGETASAAEVYLRLGDYKKVAQLAMSSGEWSRAFALAREHSECKRDVYLAYAHRMVRENNFVDAQKAYHTAGETETAMRVFSILVENAVSEERYGDAGYLHYLLAQQCLDSLPVNATETEKATALSVYTSNERFARIYYAYESVHRCVHEPFSLNEPDALLNAAVLVLAQIDVSAPPVGISIFCVYLCLAKQAKALNANSLSRQMLDKILALKIPPKFSESVELLIMRSRAISDVNEDVSYLCWRCRRHAPPLTAIRCPQCQHSMTHGLPSQEVLPLVQFELEPGISEEEALELIDRTPLPSSQLEETEAPGAQVLRIDHDIDDSDPFLDKLEEVDVDEYESVLRCSRAALLRLSPGSVVFIRRHPPLRSMFYRNMLPELPVVACPHCYNLFYMEDYECQMATIGHCPFCRQSRDQSTEEFDNTSTPSSPSGHSSTN